MLVGCLIDVGEKTAERLQPALALSANDGRDFNPSFWAILASDLRRRPVHSHHLHITETGWPKTDLEK